MKTEKEMIIDRLYILLNLIEDICTLSLSVPDYFLILKNQIIEFKSSVENSTPENQEDARKNIIHFKRQFVDLFIYHCNTKAAEYNLNWDILPPVCELEKPPNISTLRDTLSKFKQALTEKNHANKLTLNLIKNIAQAKKRLSLVPQIEGLLLALTENPHRILDNNTLSDLEQKARNQYKKQSKKKLKKKSSRLVVIADMPKFTEGPLYESISAWELSFNSQINLFNECTIDPQIKSSGLTEDVILAKYLPLFEQKTNILSRLIKSTEESLKDIKKISCHQKILDELTINHEKLTVLNEERQKFATIISERFRLIYPKANDQETLVLYKQVAFEHLENQLTYFIKQFSLTDLSNKSDPNSVIFIEKLHAFVNDLIVSLKHNALVTDKNTLDQLQVKLLEHLGKKTNFLGILQKQKSLDTEDALTLLKTLFIKDTGPATKEHIAYLYNLSAIFHNFPIKKIKDFHFLEEAQKNLNIEIFNGVENLKVEANIRINTLYSLIHLNSNMTRENTLKIANQHIVKLTEQLTKLEKIDELYQAECKSYQDVRDPIEKLSKITSLSRIQEMLMAEIVSFKKDKPNYNFSIEALKQEYNRYIDSIQYSLTESLEQTTAALTTTDSSAEEIIRITKAQRALLTTIIDTKDKATQPLKFIRREADEARFDLEAETIKCRDILYRTKHAVFQSQRVRLNDPVLIPFSDLNPFKQDAYDIDQAANSKLLAIEKDFRRLFQIPGKGLQQWLTDINTAIDSAKGSLSNRSYTIGKATILENRINSVPFITSLRIITTLEDEITRIIQRYMQKALDKTEAEEDKTTLGVIQNNPLGYLDYCNAPNAEVLLNRIDPRLFKLISIHRQFQAINGQYINRNTRLLDDVGYTQALLNSVIIHLHHDNMENLSEGKRWKFVQWIRINILKPIHQINPFKEQSHRFFPTPLACKTERDLIGLGNDVFLNLTTAAEEAATRAAVAA